MTAAATQNPPVIPPRPSRSADKEKAPSPSNNTMPAVPPRPTNKRIDRSKSPIMERFAPSPLNGGIPPKNPSSALLSPHREQLDDPIERAGSVPMPSVGEEGMEYGAVAEEIDRKRHQAASPEQTRTVAEDLKLHAPKPSLPAQSAKERVSAVTRTDSDNAASYGIGRPVSSDGRTASRDGMKKRPSTSFSIHSDRSNHDDEAEHGHHAGAHRVPMNPHLGDVQAPSPGPEEQRKHHGRKHSARGLPPGSYGLHGHGRVPQDKLEKEYYLKHPDALQRDEHTMLHDRPSDFAMSSDDLNKLVRGSGHRGISGLAEEHRATPTEEVAFQASEEYTRISNSRPGSAVAGGNNQTQPPVKDATVSGTLTSDSKPIHVDDARHPEFYHYGDEDDEPADESEEYHAPILASDEVGKEQRGPIQHPAIRPHLERSRSSYESEKAYSRPTSRPVSIHNTHSTHDFSTPTPLEDVEEYEPLFPEKEAAKAKQLEVDENRQRQHFPSKDIWEDAPNSAYFTAEVSTPERPEEHRRKSSNHQDSRPITPAKAFALHQEELAEKESRESRSRENNFLSLSEDKPTWVAHQSHLRGQRSLGSGGRRFPSRDIWEDAPESQLHQTVLSQSPPEEKPDIPARPVKKSPAIPERPAVPNRPKPRQPSEDDAVKPRPPVSDKPKPQVPSRPTKSLSGDSKDGPAAKPKPPVPSRPAGNKISALQAGFMSDLNKRLQLGPHAPKKEEPEVVEEAPKEKAPLSDARKGRARGPQRRAPAKSPVPAAVASAPSAAEPAKAMLTLSLSLPQTSWSIDPEAGDINVGSSLGKTLSSDSKPEEPVPVPASGSPDNSEEPAASTQQEDPPKEEPVKKDITEDEREAYGSIEPGTDEIPLQDQAKAEEEEIKEEEQAAEESKIENQEADDEEEKPVTTEETLVSNMAGERILETTVEKKDEGDEVEPVDIHEDVKA